MDVKRIHKLLLIAVIFGIASLACAEVKFPPRPVGTFVYDGAKLLSKEDNLAVRQACFRFKQKVGAPIVVATIPSKQAYNASHYSIEEYARQLFDHWGIGSQAVNRGILLLVSKNDREIRIEMGHDWQGTRDGECSVVVSGILVPHFRMNRFSEGIRDGVLALERFDFDVPAGYSQTPQFTPMPVATADRPMPPTEVFQDFRMIFILIIVGFAYWFLGALFGWRYVEDHDGSYRNGRRFGSGSGGGFFGGGSSGGGGFGGGSGGGGGASGKW
jgi:uncharacterized protein